jgi:hypothetical protein
VLGVELVRSISAGWNTAFVIGTILIFTAFRFMFTFVLLNSANRFREGASNQESWTWL